MKQVILKFPKTIPLGSEDAARDTAAFMTWQWSGADEMPSAFELGPFKADCVWSLAPVRYTPEDADALLKTLRVAERIVLVDHAAVAAEKSAKRRTAERMPDVRPASREQVPPSLRFLLCDEARAEANRFYRETELLSPIGLIATADHLNDRYPYMARLDDVLGGGIRKCLRTGAEVQPPPGGPYPWNWCGISVANGNPQGSARQVESAMSTMSTFRLRNGERRRPAEHDDPDRMEISDTKFFGTADAHGDPDETEDVA
ncbi:hypothetical protein [Bosea sp. 47.2.35]|uniref:hypothetical protein n=1 Tax=Bosea sp. 47.2.35 TaxID=2969304 RepID=UPI00214FD765|nr:hypothetical protein [Bosea sp. 47.2.35]MCR4521677.1 hypothetical protein [Bosea sp. 47.2.35]